MTLQKLSYLIFGLASILTLTGWLSSADCLLLGLVLAWVLGNPLIQRTQKLIHQLLAFSIVGLGGGMNLDEVAHAGVMSIGYTFLGVTLVLCCGLWLGKIGKVPQEVSWLITVGTAICGGSAIAAVAAVIKPKEEAVSVALGVIFILNSIALLLFPFIGHFLDLSQNQFGLWSAVAIHDTSSVVGATIQYGEKALEVGTTTKLVRSLWIIPVAFLFSRLKARKMTQKAQSHPASLPWFILGFLLVSGLVTWVPSFAPVGHVVYGIAKRAMGLTLFLIGTSLTRETISKIGFRPLVQAVVLWAAMASLSLVVIFSFVV